MAAKTEKKEVEKPNVNCRGRVRISCPIETLWAVLIDYAERPELYDTNIKSTYVHERAADTKLPWDRSADLANPKLRVRHKVVIEYPDYHPAKEPAGAVADLPTEETELRAVYDALRGEEEALDLAAFTAVATNEAVRDFCAQIPGMANFLDATKTEEKAKKLFDQLDTSEIYGGRRDGFVSFVEFLAFFRPQAPVKAGRVIWQVTALGPDAAALAPCKGRITQTITQVDDGIIEFATACYLFTGGDPAATDFSSWCKELPLAMKSIVERITYLCPSLGLEGLKCTKDLHRKIVMKAKSFEFMPLSTSRSPNAVGNFMRTKTPGRGDGFSAPPTFREGYEAVF